MAPRIATKKDYIELQGGFPEVSQDKKGLWHIKHTYRDDRPDVRDYRNPSEGELINIGGKLFNPRFLWEFHGAPCEAQSRKAGGWGYPRGENGERARA